MATYWDRFAGAYSRLGRAPFWLRSRVRLAEELDGRVPEVCCGGGHLVVEVLRWASAPFRTFVTRRVPRCNHNPSTGL